MSSSTYTPGSVASIIAAASAQPKVDSNLATLFRKEFTSTKKKVHKECKQNPDTDHVPKTEPVSQKRKLEEEVNVSPSKTKKLKHAKSTEVAETNTSTSHPAVRRILSKRDVEQESRTVFCGNLPVTTTRKSVLQLFSQFGKVVSVRLRSAAPNNPKLPQRAVVIRQEFHESKGNINAYVVYDSKESAEKALSLNGTKFGGLHLRVDYSAPSKKYDHKKCIFVGNLSFDASEEDLRQHFDECGDIMYVRLVRDRKTGIGKGIGYIAFEGADSVGLALKLDESKFMQRKLRVKPCTSELERKKSKYKQEKKERKKNKSQKELPREQRMELAKKAKSNSVTKRQKANFSTASLETGHYQGTKAVAFHKVKKKKKALKRLKLKKKKMTSGEIVQRPKNKANRKTQHTGQKKGEKKKVHVHNKKS